MQHSNIPVHVCLYYNMIIEQVSPKATMSVGIGSRCNHSMCTVGSKDVEAEAADFCRSTNKKSTASTPIFLKELKTNITAVLTKTDLENFVYLLLNHIGCILLRYLKKAVSPATLRVSLSSGSAIATMLLMLISKDVPDTR